MPVNRSHDKLRVETPRARDLPATPSTALTAPEREAGTGRFVKGNQASRRRALKRLAKQLPWLDPEKCGEWVRPYISAAREHAADLLASLGAVGPMASPVAEELATARLVYRALLQLGLAGDMEALEAARMWGRECRQHAVTLEHIARSQGSSDEEQKLDARRREFQRQLAERTARESAALDTNGERVVEPGGAE